MTTLIVLAVILLIWAVFFFSVAPGEMSNILQRDPAARNYFEVIFLYPGLHAIVSHRYAHFFYKHKMFLIARIISQISRMMTGIEIHPGAKIGKGLFIDHGMGIVIGETTEIGDNCTIYQNVTLGGTGKDKGKRHPTIGNNVLIGCGAKVLGPFKVGDNSKIAANAVVLYEVPENSTAVGVPARIVKVNNQKVSSMDLDQIHIPDPTSQELCRINKHIHDLEEKINKEEKKGKGMMYLKLYNSMTRQKEEFIPLHENTVNMYSCGPTVYNFFHLGNARPFIIFDQLRRYFEYRGYKVNFVQNFTDIDDKMINKANDLGITVKELGEQYIAEYFKDAKALGIKEATYHPKATEHIEEIIKLVSTLIEKGYAYDVDGDVYFQTSKFKEYGKLSKQPLEDLELGARININEAKREPLDFAVWKKQKEGEPAWESPWGMGRPGWHIECSAMANKYLGETIDIHSGGKDLMFPHHENEIAQSECANGCTFARYWMHNGFINVDNEKMSKSKGNFFTIRDIAEHFPHRVIRFFMLTAHYRSPINFSDELLGQAQSSLERIDRCFENLEFSMQGEAGAKEVNLGAYRDKFNNAMDDDLNTADAISVIFELVKDINTELGDMDAKSKENALALLTELCDVLGILKEKEEQILDSDVEALINERTEAKKAKNFARADEIRDILKDMGIILEDTRQGVKWKRV